MPSIPSIKLPFTQLPGLTLEDNHRLRRNFEEIQKGISLAPSLVNAVLDPGSANNASNHIYNDLNTLLTAEAANIGIATTQYQFVIGVVGRDGQAATFSSPATISGSIAFVGFGANYQMGVGFTAGTTTLHRPAIDWRSTLSFASSGITVSFFGMEIFSGANAGVTTMLSNTNLQQLIAYNSTFLGGDVNGSPGTQRMILGGQNVLIAYGCNFNGIVPWVGGANQTTNAYDCHFIPGGLTTMSFTGTDFVWDGGSWCTSTSLTTVTFNCTGHVWLHSNRALAAAGGAGGAPASCTLTLTAASTVDIDTGLLYLWTGQVNVGASVQQCSLRMQLTALTVTAATTTTNAIRYLDVTVQQAAAAFPNVDIAGPCMGTINLDSVAGANRHGVIVRGGYNNLDIILGSNDASGTAHLQFISCNDSLVRCVFQPTSGAGAKAYSIDAASARVYLTTAGVGAVFTVASTNASASSTVVGT